MAFIEFISIYTVGALGYGGIELLWRGHTHWTMLLTGGACFYSIYIISTHLTAPMWKKCFLCAAAVTAWEFTVGCVVNLLLGWEVWDYSNMFLNLMGQICPLFSFFWFLLSIPCSWLCGLIRSRLFSPLRQ